MGRVWYGVGGKAGSCEQRVRQSREARQSTFVASFSFRQREEAEVSLVAFPRRKVDPLQLMSAGP